MTRCGSKSPPKARLTYSISHGKIFQGTHKEHHVLMRISKKRTVKRSKKLYGHFMEVWALLSNSGHESRFTTKVPTRKMTLKAFTNTSCFLYKEHSDGVAGAALLVPFEKKWNERKSKGKDDALPFGEQREFPTLIVRITNWYKKLFPSISTLMFRVLKSDWIS